MKLLGSLAPVGLHLFVRIDLPGVMLTEVLHPDDPRTKGEVFESTLENEICDIFKRNGFRVVCPEEEGDDANVKGGQFYCQ